MTLLSGLSAFLILLIGDTSLLDSSADLRHVLHSGTYWCGSSLVSLALIAPLLTDTMINVFTRLWAMRNDQEPSRTKDIHSIMESLIFQGGMLMSVVMPFIPDSPRYPTIVQCFTRVQLFVVLGVVFASLVRFDKKFCPPYLVMVFYLLSITCNALNPYVYHTSVPLNIMTSGSVAVSATTAQYAALAIIVLALIRSILLRLWAKFGHHFGHHFGRAVSPAGAHDPSVDACNRESAYGWYRIAYMAVVLFWVFFRAILSTKTEMRSFLEYRDGELFLFNVPSIVFQLFFLVLSIRVVRLDAVASLYSLIEAKKQYVRYIRYAIRQSSGSVAFLYLCLAHTLGAFPHTQPLVLRSSTPFLVTLSPSHHLIIPYPVLHSSPHPTLTLNPPSHELRTPLSAATSGLHVLESEILHALALAPTHAPASPQSEAALAAAENIHDTLADVTLAITTSVSRRSSSTRNSNSNSSVSS
jgi:hypothetical protein